MLWEREESNKRMMIKRYFTIILIAILSSMQVCRAQLISVKTNLLQDALLVPNLDFSVTLGNRIAAGVSVFGAQKILGQQAKLWGIKPEFRYWISGRTHTGYFVGASITGVSYDINWKSEVFKGDAIGAGIVFGYDIYLSEHFTLDLHGGCGAFYYRHENYFEGDKLLKDIFKEHGAVIVPYDLGVSIVYIFR